MVNTPAHPGPFDPLGRAHPEQPFFPLMGGDPFAPPLVLDWADRTRRRARAEDDGKERERLFGKANEAEEIAWAMQAWEKHGPDGSPVVAARATYSGEPAPDDHRWKEQLAAGASALRNAAFFFAEAAGGLEPGQAAALTETVATINRIATAYEPKRASYGAQSELPLTYAEIGVA